MKLDTEVTMMLPSEVASATCMMWLPGNPFAVKTNTRMGTITTPPPIPSRPAMTPTRTPSGA